MSPDGKHTPSENQDLWSALAQELVARSTLVNVTWVLGHARRSDVQRGRTTWQDKHGNDGADALAVQGAALHDVDSNILIEARQRCETAKQVQCMMLRVLQAWLQAEQDDEDRADRGSEPGNIFDFDFDHDAAHECNIDEDRVACGATVYFCIELDDEFDNGRPTLSGVV